METIIQKLTGNDINKFCELIELFEDVFEMKDFKMPALPHLQKLLNKDDFHVFVSMQGDAVVGGLTVYTLEQYYSLKPLAYIYDLAVKQNLQRQGVGTGLMEYVKTYFADRGYEEIFVQADRVDGYALDFYRKTGPAHEEDVVHFYHIL